MAIDSGADLLAVSSATSAASGSWPLARSHPATPATVLAHSVYSLSGRWMPARSQTRRVKYSMMPSCR
jgi:hypothetical protein